MLIYHVALNIKISIFYYYFSSNEKSKIIPDIFLYYKIFMNACINLWSNYKNKEYF